MLRGFLSKNPLRKELSKNRLRKESGTADLERSRYSSRSLPSATTHQSAPVDDRSGAGGLLPGEIPRILNICTHCEPIARCPIAFMPLASRNTSAGRPVVLGTALLPSSSLSPAVKETRSDCLCLDGCAPRGNVRRAGPAGNVRVDRGNIIVENGHGSRRQIRCGAAEIGGRIA